MSLPRMICVRQAFFSAPGGRYPPRRRRRPGRRRPDDQTWRHRWGTPEDFGGVAVYLASDASRYHTGDLLVIDGGYSAF